MKKYFSPEKLEQELGGDEKMLAAILGALTLKNGKKALIAENETIASSNWKRNRVQFR